MGWFTPNAYAERAECDNCGMTVFADDLRERGHNRWICSDCRADAKARREARDNQLSAVDYGL